ncbi:MAG: hypothetical protein Terrestrivirus2_90 [Terrestrivirus sp.]|uniref:Uncharacterized protein n=1 Tax=Terrestrivirus sp. TaxID=2487775 RepID=A0A3G4ZL61_9VIRU|nr:MAG: hypothetical protein Terrestrivirus2_90 [Terrestrivirus sp.]
MQANTNNYIHVIVYIVIALIVIFVLYKLYQAVYSEHFGNENMPCSLKRPRRNYTAYGDNNDQLLLSPQAMYDMGAEEQPCDDNNGIVSDYFDRFPVEKPARFDRNSSESLEEAGSVNAYGYGGTYLGLEDVDNNQDYDKTRRVRMPGKANGCSLKYPIREYMVDSDGTPVSPSITGDNLIYKMPTENELYNSCDGSPLAWNDCVEQAGPQQEWRSDNFYPKRAIEHPERINKKLFPLHAPLSQGPRGMYEDQMIENMDNVSQETISRITNQLFSTGLPATMNANGTNTNMNSDNNAPLPLPCGSAGGATTEFGSMPISEMETNPMGQGGSTMIVPTPIMAEVSAESNNEIPPSMMAEARMKMRRNRSRGRGNGNCQISEKLIITKTC